MANPFTFEPVADNHPAGSEIGLALDKSGNPSIVFSDLQTGGLILAQRSGGIWNLDSVGGLISGAARPCLAIDSQGNPQLGYQDKASGNLLHAVRTAGRWSFTTIPTRITPGPTPFGGAGNVAFALHPGRLDTQSRDVAYFVYVDLVTDGLGFAHTGTIGPTPVVVEFDPNEKIKFAGPSVAFDGSENFFVGYSSIFPTGAPQDIISVRSKHIVDIEKGTFSDPTVIESSQFLNVRRATSIVRTGSGGCLAYFDMASKVLKASVSSFGGSSIETVATNVGNVVTPSAALKAGAFRIAYADSDAVKLASRSPCGTWSSETVEAVSAGTPSLIYDVGGTANIAYVANNRIRFARRSE